MVINNELGCVYIVVTFVRIFFFLVLGPINSLAKLKLNINPELDVPAFQIPKVDLFLEMEKLAVGITKAQYQRLIELADGMSAMTRGIPYRKFRPYQLGNCIQFINVIRILTIRSCSLQGKR